MMLVKIPLFLGTLCLFIAAAYFVHKAVRKSQYSETAEGEETIELY